MIGQALHVTRKRVKLNKTICSLTWYSQPCPRMKEMVPYQNRKIAVYNREEDV